MYYIQTIFNEKLFWSNELGWCDRLEADWFSSVDVEMLILPIDGKWAEE